MTPGLRKDALGTTESLIMGIAGTAPAYSIEATAFTIIGIAGVLSPASILVCGLIMFGIAWAFIHLNSLEANAGTSFAWVTRIFGRTTGFLAGWALLFLCCVFMVSATIPAANALLLVLAPSLVNNVNWVTGVSAFLLTIVSAIVVKGIKLTSYAQVVLTVVEALILGLIIVLGFYHFSDVPVHAFSWNWFNPFAFELSTFIQGLLVALFFYYGWDVTMNLAEETRDPQVTPGRATFWSMIFLIAFFLVFTVLILMGLTEAEIAKYNTNIIFALAEKLLGKELGYIAIIAVLLSTIGTIETQILQFTRTLFAKSRSGALDARYAKLHPSWQTPYVAVGIIWAVGMLLILLSSYLPSVNNILQTSITAIGYQICFYLGLTGFACAWEYRNLVARDLSPKSFTRVIWPFCSAACLAFVLVYSVFTADHLTNVIGLGGIALGVLPLIFRKSET